MRETLERAVERAAAEPLNSRRELFSRLSEEPVYLLHIGDRAVARSEPRKVKPGDVLAVWADVDPVWDGVWVPAFCSPESVTAYVSRRGLKAARGRHLHWMRHDMPWLFGRLLDIPCFAGVRLEPDAGGGLRLEWHEVNALSEGREPGPEPAVYDLPEAEGGLPGGVRCMLGRLEGWLGMEGRPAFFPDGGRLEGEDLRSLARFSAEGQPAWSPCRHVARALRASSSADRGAADRAAADEALIAALTQFRMYGEAEAACRRLLGVPGSAARAPFARAALARVLRLSGRLEGCIDVCRGGLADHPDERLLYVNQALAHAQLDEVEQAREVCRRGAERFPGDPDFQRFR